MLEQSLRGKSAEAFSFAVWCAWRETLEPVVVCHIVVAAGPVGLWRNWLKKIPVFLKKTGIFPSLPGILAHFTWKSLLWRIKTGTGEHLFLYRPTSAPACLESLCSGLRQKISFHKRSTYDKMIKESLQSVKRRIVNKWNRIPCRSLWELPCLTPLDLSLPV